MSLKEIWEGTRKKFGKGLVISGLIGGLTLGSFGCLGYSYSNQNSEVSKEGKQEEIVKHVNYEEFLPQGFKFKLSKNGENLKIGFNYRDFILSSPVEMDFDSDPSSDFLNEKNSDKKAETNRYVLFGGYSGGMDFGLKDNSLRYKLGIKGGYKTTENEMDVLTTLGYEIEDILNDEEKPKTEVEVSTSLPIKFLDLLYLANFFGSLETDIDETLIPFFNSYSKPEEYEFKLGTKLEPMSESNISNKLLIKTNLSNYGKKLDKFLVSDQFNLEFGKSELKLRGGYDFVENRLDGFGIEVGYDF